MYSLVVPERFKHGLDKGQESWNILCRGFKALDALATNQKLYKRDSAKTTELFHQLPRESEQAL